MQTGWEAIVVGLGAVGSATLYQLARRGVKALGIDRFAPPHDRGSSHGESRITRLALGEGGHYVPFVRRSHQIWRELEATTGQSLLHSVGGLIFGSSSDHAVAHGAEDFLSTTIAVAEGHGIRHEVLDSTALRERFPQFRFQDDERGYYEPEAGYLKPEACVAVQLQEACRLGAQVRTSERVLRWEPNRYGVRIASDKAAYEAGCVVLCAGPWLPGLMSTAGRLARTYRQVMYWFKPDGPCELFAPGRMPVYIRLPNSSADMFYGFPALNARTGELKLAGEQFVQVCDPDAMDREVSRSEKEAMHQMAVASLRIRPRCVRAVACQYTVTPDFDFVIDRFSDSDRVWIASACSGHGFKHSAAVGEALAELVTCGRTRFDLSRFKLDRFSRRDAG